ncbi:MAG: Ribosomal RNA small subunit methyltransferase H [Parcubacteria group bacterium GW2011_GWA2_47_21]|nr:MAG: Ribosomal RNA small subunit methyltransferase H [Parcubacteria group bacterium GW2011_GWA2_47_21]
MIHQSVLLSETVDSLALREGDVVLDATVGGGGASELICRRLGGRGTIIGLDADADALERAQERLKSQNCLFLPVKKNFRDLDEALSELGISPTKIIFDLGLSSNQLEESGRGFSFRKNEPLLMTFDAHPMAGLTLTARDVVNQSSEEELREIFWRYGEERFGRRIAAAIVLARKKKPIETSGELAAIVSASVPRSKTRIHPATKVFQALRIKVNDELNALSQGLRKAFETIPQGGRIAVISFHSLEDRIVKNFFRDLAREGRGTPIVKKPIAPSPDEVKANPRARSAKLRVIEKS